MTFVLLYHYQQQEITLQKLEESFANLPQQKKLKRDKAAFVEKQKKFVHDKTELQKIVSRLEKSEREKAICEEEAKKQNELLYSGLVSSQREIASLNQQIESLQEKTENLQEKVLQMMEQKEEKEKALHIMQQDLQHDYNAFQALKKEYEAQKKEINDAIAQKKEETEAVWNQLEEKWQQWYVNNKNYLRDMPLTILYKNNSCGHCHTVVPLMTGRHARKNPGTVRCEKCGSYFLAEEEMQ